MRPGRVAGIAAFLAVCVPFAGCGGEGHSEAHERQASAPAPAPPTPDTTPIDPLRTPAGMVLKINEPTAPPSLTQSPAAAPSPAASPAPAATPAATTKAG